MNGSDFKNRIHRSAWFSWSFLFVLDIVHCATSATVAGNSLLNISLLASNQRPFSECGGIIKGTSAGHIASPHFPGQFPVPIHCRWTIEAPAGQVIVLYLTQFYLRDGFRATEFAFLDSSLNIGRKELPVFSSDGPEPIVSTFIVTSKPVLVLELEVFDATNIHVRVMDFFLDVYGFNITYKVVAKEQRDQQQLTACSGTICSFTGTCLASGDYSYHYCQCFAGFFGTRCQYGPACNPSKNINPCKNGGHCGYQYGGTTVNCNCKAAFGGVDCGALSDPRTVLGQQCSKLKEEQCEGDHCFLDSGHEDNSGDQETVQQESCPCLANDDCVPLGKFRYIVTIKFYDSNVDIKHLDKARFHELKSGIELALLSSMKPYFQGATSHLRILQFKPGAEVELHFFHDDDDVDKVRSKFLDKLRTGRIGRYAVDKTFFDVRKEQALNIVSCETSASPMALMEKSELNITCSIRGSVALEVQWFKDGSAINFNKSIDRTFLHKLMPRNSNGLFTAELFIGHLDILDTGLFTCQARDFGFSLNRSIVVTVNVLAQPTVLPLTQTVQEGDKMVITCFSREDVANRRYGYNWLKNGEILNPIRENENIEDLFPTGSRIIIHQATRSAVYTCLASTPSGTALTQSLVTVIPRLNGSVAFLPTCKADHMDNLDWPETGANSNFVQQCPVGYESGTVSRKCELVNNDRTRWLEPNFSECYTQATLDIRRQFRLLRLGYGGRLISQLVEELASHLITHPLRHAEGEPILKFLTEMFDYVQKVHMDQQAFELSCDYALDILSLLFDHTGSVNSPNDLSTAHHMVLGFTLLRTTMFKGSLYSQVARKNFLAEVVAIEPQDAILKMPLTRSNGTVKRQKSTGLESVLETINQIPSWLTDTVELDVSRHSASSVQVSGQNYVLSVFYRNFGSFLPKHFLLRQRISDIEYQIHSRLVTVALLNNSSKNIGQQSKIKIRAHLKHYNTTNYIPPKELAEIACGLAELSDTRIGFNARHCQTQLTSSESTVCLCELTGTYAIILTSQLRQRIKDNQLAIDLETVAACLASIAMVSLTVLVLLVHPRTLAWPLNVLKGQICLAIIGGQLASMALLHLELFKTNVHHVHSAAMFFWLLSFSLQVSYLATAYAQVCIDRTVIKHPTVKISFLGWAIPITVEGASLAAQALESFPAHKWTFLITSRLFYTVTVTCSLLALCHFFLYITIRLEFVRRYRIDSLAHSTIKDGTMNKEATVSSSTTSSSLNAVNSHKTATKAPIANGQSGGHGWATKALNQSLVITLCLMLQLTTFIFRTNFPLDPRAGHCLTASTLLLGLVILACYSSCSTDHWHIGSEVTDDSKLVTSDSFALSALTVATAVHQASSSPSSAADLLNSTIHFGPDLIVPLDKIMTSEQIIPLADHSQFFASNHIYADHDIDTTVLQENHVTFHHGGHISHATIIN